MEVGDGGVCVGEGAGAEEDVVDCVGGRGAEKGFDDLETETGVAACDEDGFFRGGGGGGHLGGKRGGMEGFLLLDEWTLDLMIHVGWGMG